MSQSIAVGVIQQNVGVPLRKRAFNLRQRVSWMLQFFRKSKIQLDRCLRGGDCGVSVRVMSRVRGDILYGSRHISEWPHVKLLREFGRIGMGMWEPGVFEQTEYYRNAAANIDVFGNYFDAVSPDQIHWGARRFLSSSFPQHKAELLKSIPDPPIEPPEHIAVRPIEYSSCLQIVEGHHRLAALYVQGVQKARAVVMKPAITTPLQDMLLETLWLNGRRELYQPIDSPEVAGWTLIRRCTDRAELMRQFLVEEGLTPPACRSYLDVACSYGWFVREMASHGFTTEGVEADPIALSVGQLMYGLKEKQLHRSDAVTFLHSNRQFDVVSCFSLVHHFLLKRRGVTAEELLYLLDTTARRVLFFDMGEEHEYDKLRGWNPDFIQRWLEDNTTFSRVVRLGKDQDAVPPNEKSFGRTLFACVR